MWVCCLCKAHVTAYLPLLKQWCETCVSQVLSVVERLEAAGLNVICDAKRQAAEREKAQLQGTHHHDFVPS